MHKMVKLPLGVSRCHHGQMNVIEPDFGPTPSKVHSSIASMCGAHKAAHLDMVKCFFQKIYINNLM